VDLQDGCSPRDLDVDAHALARESQGSLLVLEGFTEIARYDTTSFTRELVVGPGGTFSGAEQFSVVPEAGALPRALVVLATLAYAARRRDRGPTACRRPATRAASTPSLEVPPPA
jgi:hypothetical protein